MPVSLLVLPLCLLLLFIFSSFISNKYLSDYKYHMNSDYLKKPVISKKIEYKKLDTFSYVSCEMQGKICWM